MCSGNSDSMIKETLKSFCCNNGWSYGVFWGFDQRNSLLLTLQDAYYEEYFGAAIDDMLLQVHVVGGGVIGQAAFTKKNRWVFSDHEGLNPLGSMGSFEEFKDDSELYCQFSTGIKTIAVISVEPLGVVQFGSTRKIPEQDEFVNQVKEHFKRIGGGGSMLQEITPSSSDSEILDSSNLFGSSLFMNQIQFDDEQAQSFQSNVYASSIPLEQLMFEPASYLNCTPVQAHCVSGSDSVVTSAKQHLSTCRDSVLNGHLSSMIAPLDPQYFSDEVLKNQISTMFPQSIDGRVQGSNLTAFEDLYQAYNSDMPIQSSCSFASILGSQLSPAIGFIASDLSGLGNTFNISENQPTNSMQSSITDAFNSNGKEKFSGTSKLDTMLNDFVVDHGCKNQDEWNKILMPVVHGGQLSSDNSECISGQYVGSKAGKPNSLFSKLGIDHLLDGSSSSSSSFSKSGFENQLSSVAKRRKLENHTCGGQQGKLQGLHDPDAKMKSLAPIYNYNHEKTNVFEIKTEASPKLEATSWIGDSNSKNAGNSSSPNRQEQHVKNVKKKAKPGTRPRPKDRQQIHDRLAELRELIPNGEKMSIDRLLERTIRHLNFMQSLTKYADSLKRNEKAKCGSMKYDSNCNGITWACEVDDESMVCPPIVEDLSTAGQMLIEILCEEQGFFFEIADLIRGFGLTVLKGVMEVRENKIWSHFVVEAEGNRHVTRHEVFSSLVQLLQMTGPRGANANDQLGNILNGGASMFTNCQQPIVPLPVNLADTLQCANL